MLHDIGKLGVPSAILSKAGTLRKEEFNLIKLHSVIGEEILKEVDFIFPLSTIVRQHHERLDGSGYPDGLVGNEILLEAKIIAVADVIDSMSSSRAYRKALGLSEAIDELNKNKEILYDPDVVNACCKLYKQNKLNTLPSEEVFGKTRYYLFKWNGYIKYCLLHVIQAKQVYEQQVKQSLLLEKLL